MKNLIASLLMIQVLAIPSFALAETIKCSNLDGSAKATLSEIYFDVVLLRRLQQLEVEGEVVYKHWFGKVDTSEVFKVKDIDVQIFSTGMILETEEFSYNLVCLNEDAEEWNDDQNFQEYYDSIFSK